MGFMVAFAVSERAVQLERVWLVCDDGVVTIRESRKEGKGRGEKPDKSCQDAKRTHTTPPCIGMAQRDV